MRISQLKSPNFAEWQKCAFYNSDFLDFSHKAATTQNPQFYDIKKDILQQNVASSLRKKSDDCFHG